MTRCTVIIVGWAGGSTQNTLDVPATLAEAVGLRPKTQVCISVVDAPMASALWVETESFTDWQKAHAMSQLLQEQVMLQLVAAAVGQRLPLWPYEHQCIWFRVVRAAPEAQFVQLDASGIDLIIGPPPTHPYADVSLRGRHPTRVQWTRVAASASAHVCVSEHHHDDAGFSVGLTARTMHYLSIRPGQRLVLTARRQSRRKMHVPRSAIAYAALVTPRSAPQAYAMLPRTMRCLLARDVSSFITVSRCATNDCGEDLARVPTCVVMHLVDGARAAHYPFSICCAADALETWLLNACDKPKSRATTCVPLPQNAKVDLPPIGLVEMTFHMSVREAGMARSPCSSDQATYFLHPGWTRSDGNILRVFSEQGEDLSKFSIDAHAWGVVRKNMEQMAQLATGAFVVTDYGVVCASFPGSLMDSTTVVAEGIKSSVPNLGGGVPDIELQMEAVREARSCVMACRISCSCCTTLHEQARRGMHSSLPVPTLTCYAAHGRGQWEKLPALLERARHRTSMLQLHECTRTSQAAELDEVMTLHTYASRRANVYPISTFVTTKLHMLENTIVEMNSEVASDAFSSTLVAHLLRVNTHVRTNLGEGLKPSATFGKLLKGAQLIAATQQLTPHERGPPLFAQSRLVVVDHGILRGVSAEVNTGSPPINAIPQQTFMSEIPSVDSGKWISVGGLANVRRVLAEAFLMRHDHTSLYGAAPLRLASGALLFGHPGSGKTMIAAALAADAQLPLVKVQGQSVLSKYVGASEATLREIFRRAYSSSCVLFFEELEAIAPRRAQAERGGASTNAGVSDRIVNQLLCGLDGVNEIAPTDLLVLAASNRPELIDQALLRPGRFDRLLFCHLPDRTDRLAILQVVSRKLHLDFTARDALLSFAARFDNFSGADIEALLMGAQYGAIRDTKYHPDDPEHQSHPCMGVPKATGPVCVSTGPGSPWLHAPADELRSERVQSVLSQSSKVCCVERSHVECICRSVSRSAELLEKREAAYKAFGYGDTPPSSAYAVSGR